MNTTCKVIAWICIASMLFAGCYTSTLIETRGNALPLLDAGKIDYVVTKDGTTYLFAAAPQITKDSIAGELKATAAPGCGDDPTAWKKAPKGATVSLRVADVAQVNVRESRPGYGAGTVVLGFVGVVVGIAVIAIVANGGFWEHHGEI